MYIQMIATMRSFLLIPQAYGDKLHRELLIYLQSSCCVRVISGVEDS